MNNNFLNELRVNYPRLRRYFYGADGWASDEVLRRRSLFRKIPVAIVAGVYVGSILILGNVLPTYLLDNPDYFSPLGCLVGAAILIFSLIARNKFLEPRTTRYFDTYTTHEAITAAELEELKEAPRVRDYLKRLREVGDRNELMLADILEMQHLHKEFAYYRSRDEKRRELQKAMQDVGS